MSHLIIALDVSKGYADFLAEDADDFHTQLCRVDDGPQGHDVICAVLEEAQHGYDAITVAVESTGGLERNWKRCVRNWCQLWQSSDCQVRFVVCDPRAVKRMADACGTRCKTDPSSTQAILSYIRVQRGNKVDTANDPELEHRRGWFRTVAGNDQRISEVINEIKSLLPEVHPALVQRTSNHGLPQWAVDLLCKYPTSKRLGRARPQAVAKIPHITLEKAQDLIAEAQQSTCAADSPHREVQMGALIDVLKGLRGIGQNQWNLLKKQFLHTREAEVLASITGVGDKTIVATLSEVGSLARFANADAIVGFVGLDPVFEQSGDGVVQKGISHRGPAHLRAMLYNAARTAKTHNPIIRDFYQHLVNQGKHHMVALTACMAKLLRIMYACVVSDTLFDVEVHRKHKQHQNADRRQRQPLGRKEVPEVHDPSAPISRKEKQRRAKKQQQTAVDERDQCLNTGTPAVTDKGGRGRSKGKGHDQRKKALKSTG